MNPGREALPALEAAPASVFHRVDDTPSVIPGLERGEVHLTSQDAICRRS
jgi:hypothetical protein